MDSISKKVSAFAVFKGKKDLQTSQNDSSVKRKLDVSISSQADSSIVSHSKKKKKKKQKRADSTRPSCLPDTALNSPLNNMNHIDEHDKTNGFVPPRPPKPKLPPKPPKTSQNLVPRLGKHSLDESLTHDLSVNRPMKKRKTSHQRLVDAGDEFQNPVTPFKEDIHQAQENQTQPYMFDSSLEASRLFDCLIHPVKPKKFFSELWEKKPLLVRRHMPTYNDGWFSTAELDKILRQENIQFSVNLDVTTYENGERKTHNPPGRAYAPVVWDYYQNGCSVRLLNPQTYSHNVWKFLSTLQEYFGSCTGANIYLTPPGSQGFAPHYDDIEAFILQLEGRKHWRLYSPRSDAETLPRYSSGNFKDTDIGEPILDAVLEAGDMLYFPRGCIHQGDTPEDTHSLHITVSTCQKNTWGDLLENLVPSALQTAFEEDIEFRKALPIDYLKYMGVANQDSDSPERKAFLRKIEQLMMKLLSHAPVDAACDQMGKKLMHDSLPPVFTEAERSCSIHGNGERWDMKSGGVRGAVELEPDTRVKLVRKGVIRLVMEEDIVRVYHTLENARYYHGNEPQCIEVSSEVAPAVEALIHAYPNYVSIESLPLNSLPEKIEVAAQLYEKGLLITEEPLTPLDEDEDTDKSSDDDD